MKALYDFIPLILFFTAFKIWGIYVATVVAIVASVAQVSWFWIQHKRFETTQVVTLAVILVFGGLTLIFQDDTFVKWKPSIVNWIFATIILATQFFAKKTAIERLLGKQLSLPATVWQKVNLSWGLFFLVLGLLNVYVAFYYGLDMSYEERTDMWVNFKVFGMLGLTFLFVIVQMLFIAKYIEEKPEEKT